MNRISRKSSPGRSLLWVVMLLTCMNVLVFAVAGCGPKELPPPAVEGKNASDNEEYLKKQKEVEAQKLLHNKSS